MKNILKVTHLKKSYGDFYAVKDLSFEVKAKQIFGLLGPNGAGKSTTIECILNTKVPDNGIVEILGTTKVKEVLAEIGVQFQANFYPDNIRVDEVCEMISSLYKDTENYHKMLDEFGLGDKLKSKVSKLSGGERQKLSVLLSLLNKPKLVFLDELTTGLDPQARRDVWALLKQLQEKGLTIFLTSHYMDEVEFLCDEIVLINKGEIIVQGTPKEMITKSKQPSLEEAYLHYIKEAI